MSVFFSSLVSLYRVAFRKVKKNVRFPCHPPLKIPSPPVSKMLSFSYLLSTENKLARFSWQNERQRHSIHHLRTHQPSFRCPD